MSVIKFPPDNKPKAKAKPPVKTEEIDLAKLFTNGEKGCFVQNVKNDFPKLQIRAGYYVFAPNKLPRPGSIVLVKKSNGETLVTRFSHRGKAKLLAVATWYFAELEKTEGEK
ncbi:MAG TPA: hypothetical protein VF556_08545 [Pyrinomonadaceae bacterium]|jgi:hypothetical protein